MSPRPSLFFLGPFTLSSAATATKKALSPLPVVSLPFEDLTDMADVPHKSAELAEFEMRMTDEYRIEFSKRVKQRLETQKKEVERRCRRRMRRWNRKGVFDKAANATRIANMLHVETLKHANPKIVQVAVLQEMLDELMWRRCVAALCPRCGVLWPAAYSCVPVYLCVWACSRLPPSCVFAHCRSSASATGKLMQVECLFDNIFENTAFQRVTQQGAEDKQESKGLVQQMAAGLGRKWVNRARQGLAAASKADDTDIEAEGVGAALRRAKRASVSYGQEAIAAALVGDPTAARRPSIAAPRKGSIVGARRASVARRASATRKSSVSSVAGAGTGTAAAAAAAPATTTAAASDPRTAPPSPITGPGLAGTASGAPAAPTQRNLYEGTMKTREEMRVTADGRRIAEPTVNAVARSQPVFTQHMQGVTPAVQAATDSWAAAQGAQRSEQDVSGGAEPMMQGLAASITRGAGTTPSLRPAGARASMEPEEYAELLLRDRSALVRTDVDASITLGNRRKGLKNFTQFRRTLDHERRAVRNLLRTQQGLPPEEYGHPDGDDAPATGRSATRASSFHDAKRRSQLLPISESTRRKALGHNADVSLSGVREPEVVGVRRVPTPPSMRAPTPQDLHTTPRIDSPEYAARGPDRAVLSPHPVGYTAPARHGAVSTDSDGAGATDTTAMLAMMHKVWEKCELQQAQRLDFLVKFVRVCRFACCCMLPV